MTKVLVTDTHLTDIANAIRDKNGTSEVYKPSEMASAIEGIETGIEPTGTLDIIENGVYDVTDYASANVNVPTGGGGSVEKGIVIDGFDASGYATGITIKGFDTIPGYYLDDVITQNTIFKNIGANLTIDNKTTRIGGYAFRYCDALLINELQSNITYLDQSVFRNTKITEMTCYGDITNIGNYCFAYSSLKKLVLPNITGVPTLGTSAFTTSPAIYVPDNLLESIKSATNWSAQNILPISAM